MNNHDGNWNKTRINSFFGHWPTVSAYIQNRVRIFIKFFNIPSFTAHIQRFWNANNEYCCLRENIYLSEVSTFSYLDSDLLVLLVVNKWCNLSSVNLLLAACYLLILNKLNLYNLQFSVKWPTIDMWTVDEATRIRHVTNPIVLTLILNPDMKFT